MSLSIDLLLFSHGSSCFVKGIKKTNLLPDLGLRQSVIISLPVKNKEGGPDSHRIQGKSTIFLDGSL